MLRRQCDAAFAVAEPKGALGRAAQCHRPRRVEVGQRHFRPIAALDRPDPDRDIGAEMGVGNLFHGVAARDDGLKRRRIEQHGPDRLG